MGRPKKDDIRDKKRDYRDECERVEVERRFSLAKRKCGMGLIVTKLEETISHIDRAKFCVKAKKEAVPAELMKEYVNSQQFKSTADIMEAMKEMFRDVYHID